MSGFAFVFPGQGSQSVGMLDGWDGQSQVMEVIREASDALGEDLGQLIRSGPKEALALTTNTQPVMLVAGVAAYREWIAETGLVPTVVAGHSLGEYSALVAAGALSLADAVRLVRFRAAAMQEAVPVGHGAMAVVLGMSATQVVQGCEVAAQQSGEVAEAVNFNEPTQTVIAGSKAGVEAAAALLKEQGAKRVLPLPVSAPFHSSLMKPAADRLREQLEQVDIKPPQVRLVNNVDVMIETDPVRIRDALYRQAFGPVRWVECIAAIKALGVSAVVECGPGKVLAGLTRRIDPQLASHAVFDPASLADVKGQLQ